MMNAKVKAIRTLYQHGRISKEQVYAKVPALLSAEEYEQVTGERYQET